jgi:hypothetical protein
MGAAVVAVGDAVSPRAGAGGWDLVPVAIAVGALIVLRVLFRVRLRWPVVLGLFLVAPLFRAGADRIGMPIAVLLALLTTAVAVAAIRRGGPRRFPPSNV